MNVTEFISCSPEDTFEIARKISGILQPGDIITLDGDLGAGKTVFTQGLAKFLGVVDYVTSPTFTIMNVYSGTEYEIYHFDVYRISDLEEMYEIGFDEFLASEGICIIEWSCLIDDLIPDRAYRIEIIKDSEDFNKRTVVLKSLKEIEEI